MKSLEGRGLGADEYEGGLSTLAWVPLQMVDARLFYTPEHVSIERDERYYEYCYTHVRQGTWKHKEQALSSSCGKDGDNLLSPRRDCGESLLLLCGFPARFPVAVQLLTAPKRASVDQGFRGR